MNDQLLLDLGPPPAPTLDNFVAGRNGEALAALRAVLAGQGERSLHLWGAAGSGRSHLLRAVGTRPGARYLACGSDAVPNPASLDFDHGKSENVRVWCIDDVQLTNAAGQIALFNLINASREHGFSIITSADAAPLHIGLPAEREDLRTRLGWGPVYWLQPLDDTERQAAIARHADERGLALAPEVSRYLISHFSRDMPSLIQLIDALDHYALKQHRTVTLPLIRDYVRTGAGAGAAFGALTCTDP